MGENNYDNMSYKELKQVYLQKRNVINEILEDSENSRRLSTHTPFFKRDLIEKIGDLDIIIAINKAAKALKPLVE